MVNPRKDIGADQQVLFLMALCVLKESSCTVSDKEMTCVSKETHNSDSFQSEIYMLSHHWAASQFLRTVAKLEIRNSQVFFDDCECVGVSPAGSLSRVYSCFSLWDCWEKIRHLCNSGWEEEVF